MRFKNLFIVILSVLFVASLGLNGFLSYKLVQARKTEMENQQSQRIMAFRNMFTEKVLLASKEVDFDSRLLLENAVRALNDQQIFSQWQRFTESATKEQATLEAKSLLRLLIDKTSN